jgi:hypothetical protein
VAILLYGNLPMPIMQLSQATKGNKPQELVRVTIQQFTQIVRKLPVNPKDVKLDGCTVIISVHFYTDTNILA